mgnify:CR=1 FL=1
MSELVRNAKVTVKVSETLAAVKNLGILKQQGQRRGAMWYWPGSPPTYDTAEKVYNEVRRITVNKNLEKTATTNAKSKNLIPIVGSKRPAKITKTNVTKLQANKILDSMLADVDMLFTIPQIAKNHGVDQKFFISLVELDIIQPYSQIPGGFYKLIAEHLKANRDVVIDLILGNINTKKEQPQKELSIKERAGAVLNLLEHLTTPHKGSMKSLLSDRGLAAIYQTMAIRLGYVMNSGNQNKPCYQTVGKASIDHAIEIVNAVREYWKNGDTPKVVPVFVKPTPTIETAEIKPGPVGSDLNSMLDAAIKRKAYLMAELDKVDKIIESAESITKLTAELMNN